MLTPFSSSPSLPLITPRFAECDWTDTRILLPTTPYPSLTTGVGWLVGWPTFLNLAENGSLCHFARKSVQGATVESRGGSKEPPKNCWKLHLYETMVSENVSTFCALKFGSKRAKGEQASSCLVAEGTDRETPSCASQHETGNRIVFMILYQHEIEYSLQVNVWFFRWWVGGWQRVVLVLPPKNSNYIEFNFINLVNQLNSDHFMVV